MPRNYIRKTNKGNWIAEELSAAVLDCKNGKSIRRAALDHGIPPSTLQDRINSENLNDPSLGRKSVFTHDQETMIVKHLMTMSNLFYGLTPIQLRKVVFEYAEKLNIPHRFNKAGRLAGKDWLAGFLRRNPIISIRKPEATSLNRLKGFNREEITKFFENLEKVMEKFKFTPNKIFNMDETGITTVQDTSKILATKGQKRIGAATSGERGQTTTVICAFSATGDYIPPTFIYARQRMTSTLEVNGPLNSLYLCSKNGWTNEELFLQWLRHFKKYCTPSKEEPVLLILDNHGSHINIEAYEYCKENFITLLSLPPHCSHRLQPLDVVFYGPLKTAYNKECDYFMKSNANQRITVYKIAEIFNNAYVRVATLAKGISGFATTGIFPMNPHVFGDDDFPHQKESRDQAQSSQSLPLQDISNRNVFDDDDFPIEKDAPNRQVQSFDDDDSPIEREAPNVPAQSSNRLSIEDLAPLPSISCQSGSRTMHSEIWTSTPKKDFLLEKKRKREERVKKISRKMIGEEKKRTSKLQKRTSRYLSSDSDAGSSPNETNLCQQFEESEFMEIDENKFENILLKRFTMERKPKNIVVGDYLLVKVSNEKLKKEFVSLVVELKKKSIKVKFMREYRGKRDTYVFPEVEDISDIVSKDIIGRLPKFQTMKYGKTKFC